MLVGPSWQPALGVASVLPKTPSSPAALVNTRPWTGNACTHECQTAKLTFCVCYISNLLVFAASGCRLALPTSNGAGCQLVPLTVATRHLSSSPHPRPTAPLRSDFLILPPHLRFACRGAHEGGSKLRGWREMACHLDAAAAQAFSGPGGTAGSAFGMETALVSLVA